MTSTTTDRVALILDCLGHDDTDLLGQARLWRHRDGRYVTEEEAATIEIATLGEISDAMELWEEEIKQMREHDLLRAEFLAIVGPYSTDRREPIRAAIARLPEAEMKRAAEIWQRVGPSFEAWRRGQS